jgi:hypothetical protein
VLGDNETILWYYQDITAWPYSSPPWTITSKPTSNAYIGEDSPQRWTGKPWNPLSFLKILGKQF